jgi:hypothetical protein
MPAKKSNRPLPPLRVRREPPTVDEAVIAAQALTDDIEQQVVVAAGLIGLPEDEVRPHVLNAPPPPREPMRFRDRAGNASSRSAPTVVVIQRRSRSIPGAPRPSESAVRPLRRS